MTNQWMKNPYSRKWYVTTGVTIHVTWSFLQLAIFYHLSKATTRFVVTCLHLQQKNCLLQLKLLSQPHFELRLDGIRPWSLPNPTWKAMPPHGGGQWDKRKGRAMATLGSSSRTALKSNLSQGISTTSRGANFMTLWMPQMKILRQYVRACFEFMLEIRHMHELDCVCANLWWGFQLGPSESLRKIGPLHYAKPSRKWKAFRMWGRAKNPGSRRTTSSFTRS